MYLRFVSEAMKDGTISASAVVFPKEADFAVSRLECQLPIDGLLRGCSMKLHARTLASHHFQSQAGKKMMW